MPLKKEELLRKRNIRLQEENDQLRNQLAFLSEANRDSRRLASRLIADLQACQRQMRELSDEHRRKQELLQDLIGKLRACSQSLRSLPERGGAHE
ncbi:MAG TPA: hypothetical protein IAB98_02090 [Candidatus Egerieimonas intestinavium]|uniref:Uncharacterized protein n=1 Tax=Candidatus Egerieimonas intestinavium TaxID=2840777 RepID=A0A9D1EIB8_9FIRM|nr:hypothetical protein [Candidatus Egerieimonas intestinavium]